MYRFGKNHKRYIEIKTGIEFIKQKYIDIGNGIVKRTLNEIPIELYDYDTRDDRHITCGGGFTSIIGVAILVLSQVHSFGMSG